MNKPSFTVTEKVLIQRINRKLDPHYEKLCKSRTWSTDLGDYYIRNYNYNSIVAAHVDIEKLGRELKVLDSHERLQEEE